MRRLIGLAALTILILIYLTTLQTIPNGSEHYYMIDVGETQNVLNQWGTLHATGYPLYVIVSNVLVTLLRALGMDSATAPGVTSLIYAVVALGLIYLLALEVTQKPWLAAGMVLLFGLTRTVWVHAAIAEVYFFGLMFLAALLLLTLWRKPIRGRVYWLALLGGIGAFHHRAIAMAAPALLYAVWGEIFTQSSSGQQKTRPHVLVVVQRLIICGLLGLIGFAQYAYLPLRAQAGAKWVYGEPGTWDGFWDQFLGREASRFIGAPATNAGMLANLNLVNTVLVTDLTLPGVLLGLAGLLLALRNPARRKVAITMLLSGGVAYAFHVLLYTDVLSALILPVTLSLAFGWLLLVEAIYTFFTTKTQSAQRNETPSTVYGGGLGRGFLGRSLTILFVVAFATYLITQNLPFIREMTTNPTGLETIELAKSAPEGSVLMLDWGPRYFAVGFAHDVWGELPTITLATHKADFKALAVEQGRELVTADFTFYNRPVSWWEEQLGQPVYLRAAAPHLVEIGTSPLMAAVANQPGVEVNTADVVCRTATIELQVNWVATDTPDHDLSVFVHLLDKDGAMIAQADASAPVFGWRPLTTWRTGEVVHDVYELPRLPDADSIAYGLYRQLPGGEFNNEYTFNAAVTCENE